MGGDGGTCDGDHGGNVSEKDWKQAIAEAKKLDAQQNYDDAVEQYNKAVLPKTERAKAELLESELERLQGEGYELKIIDHKLAGKCTKEQLEGFVPLPDCGYLIEWDNAGIS